MSVELPTLNRYKYNTIQYNTIGSSRSRFFWSGWVVWATNTWAVGLARRCRRRFDPRSRSFSLSSTSVFSSLPSTSKFISSRCSFSCHSPLCPAPVRPGCLFCLYLSLLSPSSQPPIDRVSPNVALIVRGPIQKFRPFISFRGEEGLIS